MLRYEQDEISNILEQKAQVNSAYCGCSDSADVFFIFWTPGSSHPHYQCASCDRDYCLFGCALPEIPHEQEDVQPSWNGYPWNGDRCSVCGEPQFDTEGGPSCPQGHGGAPALGH